MSFGNIGDYLAKFKNLSSPDTFIKTKCIKVIQDEFKITLQKNDISVSGGVLYIKTRGALKSEIYMRKATLLRALEKEGVSGIRDIR